MMLYMLDVQTAQYLWSPFNVKSNTLIFIGHEAKAHISINLYNWAN